jgi:hypothetical protein
MARRARCLDWTLIEVKVAKGDGAVAVAFDDWSDGSRVGMSLRLMMHLPGRWPKEASADQVAEQLQEGSLLRPRQQRLRVMARSCRRRLGRGRGGTRSSMGSDMRHLPVGEKRVAGTKAPAPATPLR